MTTKATTAEKLRWLRVHRGPQFVAALKRRAWSVRKGWAGWLRTHERYTKRQILEVALHLAASCAQDGLDLAAANGQQVEFDEIDAAFKRFEEEAKRLKSGGLI